MSQKNLLSRGYYVAETSPDHTPKHLVQAATAELLFAGFIVDPKDLAGVSVSDLTSLIRNAREVGLVNIKARPMYPNFPAEVRETDTLTLIVDQIVHYLSYGEYVPDTEIQKRTNLPLEDSLRASRPLEVIDKHRCLELYRDIVSQPRAISESDVETLKEIVSYLTSVSFTETEFIDVLEEIVQTLRISENIGYAVYAAKDVLTTQYVTRLIAAARRPDDVARIYLSAFTHNESLETVGRIDVSKKKTPQLAFISAPRAVRRVLTRKVISLFRNTTGQFAADVFVARQSVWKRIFTSIHAYEYAGEDTQLLDIVMDNVEYKTLMSAYRDLLREEKYDEAVSLLSTNAPGLLLRNTVSLAAHVQDISALVHAVGSAAKKAPVTTTISLINALRENVSDSQKIRYIAGEGNSVVDTVSVDKTVARRLEKTLRESIQATFSSADVAETLSVKNGEHPVPLVFRDAASTDRASFVRGQRVSLGDDFGTVRFFVHWWSDQRRSIDIDLGVVFADKTGNFIDGVDYATYAGHRDAITFSGDIIACSPEGSSEYFDIDIEKVKKLYPDARYVAQSVVLYSGAGNIKDVSHVAGIMLRSEPDSGEIFEPRSVVTASTCNQPGTSLVVAVYDLETGEMMWGDVSTGSGALFTRTSSSDLHLVMKKIISPVSYSVTEFLEDVAAGSGSHLDYDEAVDMSVVKDLLA